MFCRNLRFSLLSLVFLSLTFLSCSRKPAPAVVRVAVLPLDNEGADSETDDGGRAAAAALVYDLTGLPNRYFETVNSISAAYSMRASEALQGYYFERKGRIEVRAVLKNLERKKTLESSRWKRLHRMDCWQP